MRKTKLKSSYNVASTRPFILDKFGSPIKKEASGLYEGSSATKQIYRTIYNTNVYATDYHDNVTSGDWETLLSRSRELYANLSPIASTIRELCRLSIGDAWTAKFRGKDTAKSEKWAELTYDFLDGWYNTGNFVGGQWTFQQSLRNIVLSVLRDGDCFVILTEDQYGYPKYQLLPAHRVKGDKINGGIYKNYRIYNGIIVDKLGNPVAYNVVNTNGEPDIQISARDMVHVYDPQWVDGRRGTPHIASAIPAWTEYKEILESELRSLKAMSNFAIQMVLPEEQIKDMETGEYSDSPFSQRLTENTSAGEKTLYVEKSQLGGEILMFKPSDGAEIKPIEFNRPSSNMTQFLLSLILRNCFSSLDVPSEFAFQLDGGGATVRNLAAKIQKRVEEIQCHLIRPVWYRLIRYSIAKAIKNGYLPESPDWDQWEPTYPREYTVDNGRDTKADIELYKIGVYTGEILAAQYGYDYYDNIKQKVAEGRYIVEESNDAGIDPSFVVQTTPNANNTVGTQTDNNNNTEKTPE